VPEKPEAEPQEPNAPAAPAGADPNASPFPSPTYETVEKGIDGPWEKRDDD